jgi:hypothetical protein
MARLIFLLVLASILVATLGALRYGGSFSWTDGH